MVAAVSQDIPMPELIELWPSLCSFLAAHLPPTAVGSSLEELEEGPPL